MGLKAVKTMLKGLWVGSTMTVPGVSGGTMAVVIGIYEELIEAVNGFLKHPGKYALFLLQFVLAGAAGFLFFARFFSFDPLLKPFLSIYFCENCPKISSVVANYFRPCYKHMHEVRN